MFAISPPPVAESPSLNEDRGLHLGECTLLGVRSGHHMVRSTKTEACTSVNARVLEDLVRPGDRSTKTEACTSVNGDPPEDCQAPISIAQRRPRLAPR